MSNLDQEKVLYKVVRNQEEQYSIWRTDQEIPRGWHDTGTCGTKEVCLQYIKEVWTDLRPLSLRQRPG